MAQELQYYGTLAQTGLTVTCEIRNPDGSLATTEACTEVGTTAIYIGDFDTTIEIAGTYGLRFFSSGSLLGQGLIYWDGVAEINLVSLNAKIALIPTTPLLTGDARLNNLDATISSRLASASYAAPDNSGVAANGAAIAALNDFNPSTDVVARVTLVDTTTVNSDMRGTNNALLAASYTAPDNAGIAANGTAIANLNDFDPSTESVTASNMRGTDNALLAAGYTTPPTVQEIDTELSNNHGAGSWDGGGASAPTEEEMYTYFTSLNREDVFKADVSGLSTFNPTTDTVARVTLVDTTTLNTDMRGTDGANTTTPPSETDIADAVWAKTLS